MRVVINAASIALLSLAISASVARAQRTYVSHRIVGTGTADLSFTTDGTIETLTALNFTDWIITVSSGANTFTLLGPLRGL